MAYSSQIISITKEPFTSDYRRNCGWRVTIKFIMTNSLYRDKLLNNTELYISKKGDNFFEYSQCVTETPTTLGALQELEDIKNGIISDKYISPVERYILNALQTLDLYWD